MTIDINLRWRGCAAKHDRRRPLNFYDGVYPKQEARFDRHFVRDLTWSRHQLEELANRRFIAAQHSARYSTPGELNCWNSYNFRSI